MFKSLLLSLLCVSALLGPLAASAETKEKSVREEIEQLVAAKAPAKAIVGVYVVDAATSQVLVNLSGERPLKPASCNKLLTTAAGLSLLGPDFTFVTDLLADGTIEEGTLRGDLVIRGGGDPSISGRFQQDKKDVTFTLRKWAEDLKTSGIRRIEGRILADDTIFDRDYFHSSWYPDERGEWYEAEISGLAFNDNCVDLTWSSKECLPSQPACVVMNPPTRYVNFANQVLVVAQGRNSGREYKRNDGSNDIVATGTISLDMLKEDSASVSNGPLYFATVFHEVLTSAGIEVRGSPELIDPAQAPQIARRARLVTRHISPPLVELVKVVNLNSQNFYADCLLKMLGRVHKGEGSFAAGCEVVEQFCRERGLFCQGHEMVDGSGLSGKNRVSPRQLVELIAAMDSGALRELWRATLPQGGTRGTLRSRFQQSAESRALAPRIWGKTGLIGGVRSLSGIVQNASGREMYYSIVLNDLRVGAAEAIAFLDSLAVALARSK